MVGSGSGIKHPGSATLQKYQYLLLQLIAVEPGAVGVEIDHVQL
jgi:hypothetical protein